MLKFPKSTSTKAIRILFGLYDFKTRNNILQKKYYSKIESTPETFSGLMISHLNSISAITRNKTSYYKFKHTIRNTDFLASEFKNNYFTNFQLSNETIPKNISYFNKINYLLEFNIQSMSRKQARRLLLWRVGIVPGHSNRRCHVCGSILNREHVVSCQPLLLEPIINYLNSLPSRVPQNYHSILDEAIDLLSFTSNRKSVDYKWRIITTCFDNICNKILGWN